MFMRVNSKCAHQVRPPFSRLRTGTEPSVILDESSCAHVSPDSYTSANLVEDIEHDRDVIRSLLLLQPRGRH